MMEITISKRFAKLSYALFLLVSTGLVFFSFEGYSLLSNTTSHLGAQGSPNAWLMNLVFVCLGLMAALTTYTTRIRFHQVMGAIFGLSLVMTAFFQHAPLVPGIPVNQLHDMWHSVFASSTGFSFTILAAGHAFLSQNRQRYVALFMAVIATVIPLGMMAFPAYMGLFQRLMFISAFGWLFFFMKAPQQGSPVDFQ